MHFGTRHWPPLEQNPEVITVHIYLFGVTILSRCLLCWSLLSLGFLGWSLLFLGDAFRLGLEGDAFLFPRPKLCV